MESGARHFILANQPNLSVVPAVTLQENPDLVGAMLLSLAFNEALEDALSDIEDAAAAAGRDVHIARIDAFALTSQLAENPEPLGLDDGSTPCLTFGVIGNAICENRDGHFYWDAIHPTRAGHAVIARKALEALAVE